MKITICFDCYQYISSVSQAERDRVERQTEAIYRKTLSIKTKNQTNDAVSSELKMDPEIRRNLNEPISSKPVKKERPVSARGGRYSLFNKSSKMVEPSCIQVPCSLSHRLNQNKISDKSSELKSEECQKEIDLSGTSEYFEKMSLSPEEAHISNNNNSEETEQGLLLNDSRNDNVTVMEVGGGAWS